MSLLEQRPFPFSTERWVILISLVLCVVNGQSKTLRVCAPGQSRASGPATFTSINKAIQMAAAGDTVLLMPGTYREVLLLNRRAGRDGSPILIAGASENPDGYPVIDGGATEPSSSAEENWIILKECSWINFSRIEFRNGWTFPIQIENSSYVSFLSCRFFGGKRVISVGGESSHHVLVEGCFWDQGGDRLWTIKKDTAGVDAWTSMHHGHMKYFNGSLIDFSGTGGSMVIRYNTIVNAFNGVRYRGRPGHDTNVEIYGNHVSNIRDNDFEPEYYTYNLHIYHNVSHNIHRTLSIDEVEGGNIYYYGNVVTSDGDPWTESVCIGFWKIISERRKLSYPVYAFNNSLYGYGQSFGTRRGMPALLRHWNNAYDFAGTNGWLLQNWDVGNDFDHDISNKPWPATLVSNAQEEHGRIAGVRFSDPVHGDLHLAADSPAIDAGKVVSLPEFGWTQQYLGKAPDVGAFEGDGLVEGPPFRFMLPPGVSVNYREKPRIVRHAVAGDSVVLYFSDKIDRASLRQQDISVFKGETTVPVAAVLLADDYRLIIRVGSMPSDRGLSLNLGASLRGLNGERVTGWGSTVSLRNWPVTGESQ